MPWGLLRVPEGKRSSELERLRTPPVRASGRVLAYQLDRVAEIGNLGAGRVDAGEVPTAKLTALAK